MSSAIPITMLTLSNGIYSYLRPILIQARILGVYMFVVSDHGASSFSILSCFHTVVMMVLMVVAGVYFVGQPHPLFRNVTAYLAVVTILLFVCSYIMKRRALWSCLALVNQINLGFRSLEISYSFEKNKVLLRSYIKYAICLVMSSLDAYCFSSNLWTWEGFSSIFCIYYFYFILSNFYELFYCIVDVIGEHFAKINETVCSNWSHLLHSGQLGRIIQLHCDLCDASALLESAYSFPLLVVSTFTFLNTSFNIYAVIFSIADIIATEDKRWDLLALKIFWTVVSVSQFWIQVNHICFLEEEAENLTNIISRLTVNDKRIIHYELLNLFLAAKPKVSFWAHRFFKIDKALLFSMFAASAIYIAILLQFFPARHK